MKLALMLFAFWFSHAADARSACESRITRELEQCAKRNYDEADAALNRDYSHFRDTLSDVEKAKLQAVQRSWVAYKTRYCQDAFEATNSGDEAGIEMWSCFEAVTDARSKEINFIYGYSSMKEYDSALTFMANEYEHGDRSRVIDKLTRDVPDANSADWKKYLNGNCQITREKLAEDHDACVARMNFYKNW